MADLQTAASRLGLHLEGYRVSSGDAPLRWPVIAAIEGRGGGPGHYITLVPAGTMGRLVQVIDPPLAPRIVDYELILESCGNSPSWCPPGPGFAAPFSSHWPDSSQSQPPCSFRCERADIGKRVLQGDSVRG